MSYYLRVRRIFTPLLVAVIGLSGLASMAGACWAHDREHDEAREVVERGEALPLEEILARLRGDIAGELVGVSFKRKHGRWVYEFKVVGPAGRLSEIYVDAASAQILKREER